MPDFANPFVGMVPRKMTKEELIRAIRLNISAEHEATQQYMAHADATDDPLAKKVLIDIANEERVHVGEFERLLKYLAPDEELFYQDGYLEVEEMKAELDGQVTHVPIEHMLHEHDVVAAAEEAEASGEGEAPVEDMGAVRTIGSLIDK